MICSDMCAFNIKHSCANVKKRHSQSGYVLLGLQICGKDHSSCKNNFSDVTTCTRFSPLGASHKQYRC